MAVAFDAGYVLATRGKRPAAPEFNRASVCECGPSFLRPLSDGAACPGLVRARSIARNSLPALWRVEFRFVPRAFELPIPGGTLVDAADAGARLVAGFLCFRDSVWGLRPACWKEENLREPVIAARRKCRS